MIETGNMKNILKKNTMLIALIAVMLFFQILITSRGIGSLFAPANISNLINQNSYVVILASGMLLCILTGGNIDLSVGSIVALVGAVAGTLIVNLQMNIFVSILICLLVGLLIGAWQGFWIAYVRIPPFIVTLAGMMLWRGVALLILNGLTISPFPVHIRNTSPVSCLQMPVLKSSSRLPLLSASSSAWHMLHMLSLTVSRKPEKAIPQNL